MTVVVTRAEAKARGLTRYFTGKACKWGHVAWRSTKHGTCAACASARVISDEQRKKNVAYMRAKRATDAGKKANRQYARDWRAANIDRARANKREWNARNTEKVSEYNAAMYAADPQYHRERRKAWYRKNRHIAAEQHRRYLHERPLLNSIRCQARRARIINAPGRGLTVEQVNRICIKQKGRCFYCAKKRRLTIDHKTALARGGSHDVRNVVLACRPCNSKKKDRPVHVFLAEMTV